MACSLRTGWEGGLDGGEETWSPRNGSNQRLSRWTVRGIAGHTAGVTGPGPQGIGEIRRVGGALQEMKYSPMNRRDNSFDSFHGSSFIPSSQVPGEEGEESGPRRDREKVDADHGVYSQTSPALYSNSKPTFIEHINN